MNPPARTARRTTAAVLATTVALAAVLAGCTAAPEPDPTTVVPPAPTPTDVDAAFAGYYTQELAWQACGELQCATAEVPLDWSDASAGSISIALNRIPAGGERVGSLLVNPGGPGSSGTQAVAEGLADRISAGVREAYDVVGFDPRGVGGSTPIVCLDDARMDHLVSVDLDLSAEAGRAEAATLYRELGEACLAGTGELLAHVDTVSAARDLDVLRAVLGDESLHYLGYSYGTQLGATYAALFPSRVGRLVLDGGLDPTLTYDETTIGQAAGFELALRGYVADCQTGRDCPLTGGLENGLSQVRALLDRARSRPLPTDSGRVVTGALAATGIAVTLYDDASWAYLTQALREAMTAGTGNLLLLLADLYYERDDTGAFTSNSTEAFWAIGCADDRGDPDLAAMTAQAAAVAEVAPTVAETFSFGALLCADWPVPEAGGLDDYSAAGAAPILVVGTTNDPATPFAWSQRLAQTLSSGVLLTWEGEGHTAYGRSNSCVADAVDGYLLDGTPPAEGTVC